MTRNHLGALLWLRWQWGILETSNDGVGFGKDCLNPMRQHPEQLEKGISIGEDSPLLYFG